MFDREQFITAKKVAALTTFSPSTIDRKVRAGEFPEPIRISERRKVWSQSAVEHWMAEASAKAQTRAA